MKTKVLLVTVSEDNQDYDCDYGHTFEPLQGKTPVIKKIQSGEISSLDDYYQETGTRFLAKMMPKPWKHMKISAGSQGNAFVVVMTAADKFDEDLGYDVARTEEKIFVSPMSNLHDEFMQRQQQAEQRIKGTLQNLSELRKQKHMLEHDIRKLRSRVENFTTDDETALKADFIELVDGAGAQQGGDEASLKFYRDQNIYPSIVADFNEMSGVEDLEGDGHLADLPENIKAILKKKYVMYEKWKDLYGSEVRRKLQDIQSQLKSIERSIDETKEWLEPYVKDIIRIHDKDSSDLAAEYNKYYTFEGYSSMERSLEFICHKGLKKDPDTGDLIVEEDDPTHYRVVYIQGVQVNLADPSQPTSPGNGPATGVVMWHPMIVCKHVFDNIFQEKIDWNKEQYLSLLDDYQGNIDSRKGDEIKQARKDKFGSVRDFRSKLDEELDQNLPLEFSSVFRRVEDGIDHPEKIEMNFNKEVFDKMCELLELDWEEEEIEENALSSARKKINEFVGVAQSNPFYLDSGQQAGAKKDLETEFKFSYYISYKKGKGYYTMN